MDIEIFEEEISFESLGKTTFHNEQYFRDTMHMPVVNAFLDDDNMSEITVRCAGSSWVHTTFKKKYRNKNMQKLANKDLSFIFEIL